MIKLSVLNFPSTIWRFFIEEGILVLGQYRLKCINVYLNAKNLIYPSLGLLKKGERCYSIKNHKGFDVYFLERFSLLCQKTIDIPLVP